MQRTESVFSVGSVLKQYPISTYKEGDNIKILYLNDTVSILYKDDYVLYKFGAATQFETGKTIAGTEQYYLSKRNMSTGLLFSSFRDSTPGTKLSLDSFNLRIGRGTDFDIPADTIWKKAQENIVTGSNELVDSYALIDPSKAGPMMFDSIIYHFAPPLENVDFALSKKVTKDKHQTLQKAIFVRNKTQVSGNPAENLRSEFRFELRPFEPTNKDSLVTFIQSRKKYL